MSDLFSDYSKEENKAETSYQPAHGLVEEACDASHGVSGESGDKLDILRFGTYMTRQDKASSIVFKKETANWETDWEILHDALKKYADYAKYAEGKKKSLDLYC